MWDIYFILLMGFFCPRSVEPEVYFVRQLGKENRSDYELTPQNKQYIEDLNKHLAEWFAKQEKVIKPE